MRPSVKSVQMAITFLFRGVNSSIYDSGKGLDPKRNDPFLHGAEYGEATYWNGWTYGETEVNAVIKHQRHQKGFPTSGISTTPIYERAVFYALGGGKHKVGYVYRIDRDSLADHCVQEFIVSDFTDAPSVPEDQEVVLLAENGGSLPKALVIETIHVVGNA